MTATWHTPSTWSVGQLVTATNLNDQLRDNLEFLKGPPTAVYKLDQGSDYTTTSTSFVNVDATNLSLTITTAGGDVLVVFSGSLQGTSRVYLEITVDGTAQATNDGIFCLQNAGAPVPATFAWLVRGLSAGSHTFKLQWKVDSGTGTLHAGAGTASFDVHPQFWVREF